MLFIVSSIAASGKTTLVEHVKEKFKLYKLKTCTTRPIRDEEKGNEYYFITEEVFSSMIYANKFIEWAHVYDYYYGLTKEEVEKNKNKYCIVILDVQGTQSILKLYPEAVSIFILPPSRSEVETRLLGRNTSKNDVDIRLEKMNVELLEAENYDYRVDYGDLDAMKAQISKIIEKELFFLD